MNTALNKFLGPVFVISVLTQGCAVVDHIKADMATMQAEKAHNEGRYDAAAESYRDADLAGGAYAQMMLGRMYLEGRGVRKDIEEGRRLIAKAADSGYGPAQSMLGLLYWQGGYGLRADQTRAVKQFRQAADNGDDFGAFMLGVAYARGLGVSRNTEEAVQWFSEAEQRGYAVDERLLSEEGLASYIKKTPRPTPAGEGQRYLVREIQQKLLESGFDPGPIDGLYGAKTRKAIEDFQKENGMAIDGKASRILLDALRKN